MSVIKIICVDDEKLIMELTVSMCRSLPHRPKVIGFQKGADALERFKIYRADNAMPGSAIFRR